MKRTYMYMLTLALLMSSGATFIACNCDDVNSAEAEWAKKPTNPVLKGTVSTLGGRPLANAQVTITLSASESYTVSTDAKGNYTIDNLKKGTYPTLAVYTSDKQYNQATDKVELQDNLVTVWNVVLYPISTTTIREGNLYSIALPDVVEQDKTTQTQIATYAVPAGSLEEEDELQLTAWYDMKKTNAATRSFSYTGNDVVVVVKSYSKSGATTTKKPIRVTALDLVEPSKVIHNGKEITSVSAEDESGCYTYFDTQELGETQFYYSIDKSETVLSTQPITFSPSEFSNYATSVSTSFNYITGSEIVFQQNFLDQYVAILEGAIKTTTTPTDLNIQFLVPAGEKAILSGSQQVLTYTYKCGWATVPVKRYTDISYGFQDRVHTGGSE